MLTCRENMTVTCMYHVCGSATITTTTTTTIKTVVVF